MCKPESYQHMSSDNCICLRNIHALSRYNTWPSPNKILSEVFHSTEETSNSFNLFLFPSWMNLACCRTLKKKKGLITYVCEWVQGFSPSIMFLRCVHGFTCINGLFPFIAEFYHMTLSQFVYPSSIYDHLGCSSILDNSELNGCDSL